MSAPQPLRHTITSLVRSGRLDALTFDPYAEHYARHEDLVACLASLLDVDHMIDMGPVLTYLLPGMRRPEDCWTELTEPLEQFVRLDGNVAVSIEQERGRRFPNACDSYARIADELRQEIGLVIRRHRTLTENGHVA